MVSGPRTARTPWWRAAWFVLLAVACSWVPLFALLATTGDPAANVLSGALWVAGGLGPALAAVIVAAAADGGTGLRRLWHSLTRWRLGRWYLLLLAPAPVAVTAVVAAAAAGPAQIDIAGLAQWYLLPALFLGGVLLGGLEEIGWRGHLLPTLQERWSALAASVVVGLVWSAWHVPLFFLDNTTQASTSMGWFTVQAVGLSVVFTWLYNSSRGSTLLAVLVHGAVNAWYTAAVRGLAPDTLETFMPYAALLIAAAAALLLWRYGAAHLSRRQRATWSVPPAGART